MRPVDMAAAPQSATGTRCRCPGRLQTRSTPSRATPELRGRRSLTPLVALYGSVHLSFVPEFSPGLEGVVAAETAVSEVDGANGRLIYRGGYLIEDLAPIATFEETAYLLWNDRLPETADLDALCRQMAAARGLKDAGRGSLVALDPATDA